MMRGEWKHIIRLFLMELNSNSIFQRTPFERRHVFRVLTKTRIHRLVNHGEDIIMATSLIGLR